MMTQSRPANSVRTQSRLASARAGCIGRLFIPAFVVLGGLLVSDVYSGPQPNTQYKEYEVKAAFMYNFLKFVDWPEGKTAKSGKQMIIGIIGENPFGPAVDIFKDKTVEDRSLIVKQFEGIHQLEGMAEKDKNERIEAIKECYLLFICPSEQKQVREIIDIVGKSGVLTVGDTREFIESGGVIGFVLEDNKIRFDISIPAAEKAGLKIRSQLLRLAKRVVKDENAPAGDDQAVSSKEKN
jgi:hypothetical protein